MIQKTLMNIVKHFLTTDTMWVMESNVPQKQCRFWRFVDSLCVHLLYHLHLFTSRNLLPFSLAYILLSYLLLIHLYRWRSEDL